MVHFVCLICGLCTIYLHVPGCCYAYTMHFVHPTTDSSVHFSTPGSYTLCEIHCHNSPCIKDRPAQNPTVPPFVHILINVIHSTTQHAYYCNTCNKSLSLVISTHVGVNVCVASVTAMTSASNYQSCSSRFEMTRWLEIYLKFIFYLKLAFGQDGI
jgi:hypothetical protein